MSSTGVRAAAVDLGAQSGRVAVGTFDGSRVGLDVVHRFGHAPIWLPDGLHWNLPGLFAEVLHGLAQAAAQPIAGIGVDSWGCDYALLGKDDRMLGLPFHYRDPARSTPEVMTRVHERVSREELYARTGIQTLAINTIFQLMAEFGSWPAGPELGGNPSLDGVERIALIPDLICLWLTGRLVNEVTVASTTGLLEATGPCWAVDLVERLDLPCAPFAGTVVPPGVEIGPVLAGHGAAGDAAGAIVRTVASHDTASAFAAVAGPGAAVLSCGTWSLVGLELDEPVLGPDAQAFNLTNERGLADSTRLLANVMGMWLIEECRREWGMVDYRELYGEAAAATSDVPLFDPDHGSLLNPGPMQGRIESLIETAGQQRPASRGELVRSVLCSLACKYRVVLERLEAVSGRSVDTIHLVGGGVRNPLLCRLTADLTGRAVVAGPAEATLLGNVLAQLLALGEVAHPGEMRALAAASVKSVRYEPARDNSGIYERFLTVAGLGSSHPGPVPV